jgi:hypothetical protein
LSVAAGDSSISGDSPGLVAEGDSLTPGVILGTGLTTGDTVGLGEGITFSTCLQPQSVRTIKTPSNINAIFFMFLITSIAFPHHYSTGTRRRCVRVCMPSGRSLALDRPYHPSGDFTYCSYDLAGLHSQFFLVRRERDARYRAGRDSDTQTFKKRSRIHFVCHLQTDSCANHFSPQGEKILAPGGKNMQPKNVFERLFTAAAPRTAALPDLDTSLRCRGRFYLTREIMSTNPRF